jgi:hypothetical protein
MEEKARAFAAQARADPIYAFNSVLKSSKLNASKSTEKR